MIKRSIAACLALSLVLPVGSASAETGVTDRELKIGSCSVLSGPAELLGKRQVQGAKAYLNEVNEKGGVHGRKISLIEGDDRYEPDGAVECFTKTILGSGVFAGAFFVGTPTGAKHAPMAEANKVPVLGWFTGAGLLYKPFKRYVFNVRASYADETRDQVDGMWNELGYRKIAVIYQEDAFGVAVLEGVKNALKAHNAEVVALGAFARNTLDVDRAIEQVSAAKPEGVVVVGPYKPVAEIVKRSKAKSWSPLFVTVSFVGTEALLEELGKEGDGVVITQVMPAYTDPSIPAIKHYLANMKKYFPAERPSFSSVEGFVDAMALVEGLKRAGKDPTREGFVAAVEGMGGVDLGLGPGLQLTFSADNHKGLEKVYRTIGRGGKPVVFKSWAELKTAAAK